MYVFFTTHSVEVVVAITQITAQNMQHVIGDFTMIILAAITKQLPVFTASPLHPSYFYVQ